jgi:hypothetical protein
MSDTNEKESKGFTVTDRRGETRDESPKAEPQIPPKRPSPKETGHRHAHKIDFATFIMSLSTSAFVHLGLVEDPVTRQKDKDLELARQDIDLLEMIGEKTKGNLSAQEAEMMEQVLYELRLRFVEATRQG